jgi:ribosomal-protein-alanine N-acetyltransferase
MLAVYGDALTMRWVGDGRPLTRPECVQWIENIQRGYATRGYGMTALAARESGVIVGFCGLVHPGGQADAELKYALRRDYWGQGFATEGARALIDYAIEVLHLSTIVATAAPEHAASHRILLKIGLAAAGSRRNHDGTTTCLFAWSAKAPSDAP